MKRILRLNPAALVAAILFATPCVNAEEVVARTELLQTGEPARVHNPDCSDGFGITAANLVLWLGPKILDSFIGYPVLSEAFSRMSEGNRNWFKVRMGLHDGPSHCATQCVVVPRVSFRGVACLSETGGDGLECHEQAADYPWGRVENFTITWTANYGVFCASGKNWSHNRNRWFTVKAIY
jgi:hypothetical protein